MDWARLNAAGNAAVAKVNPAAAGRGVVQADRLGDTPCGLFTRRDGRIVTVRSFYDVAPDVSKNVPMLIGNVSEEGNHMSSRPYEDEWHETLARTWGANKAAALITAMKKKYPEEEYSPAVLWGEWGQLAQQRAAYGEAEIRPEKRARLSILLHLAIADAGRRGRVAHSRTRVLLR